MTNFTRLQHYPLAEQHAVGGRKVLTRNPAFMFNHLHQDTLRNARSTLFCDEPQQSKPPPSMAPLGVTFLCVLFRAPGLLAYPLNKSRTALAGPCQGALRDCWLKACAVRGGFIPPFPLFSTIVTRLVILFRYIIYNILLEDYDGRSHRYLSEVNRD